MEGVPLYRLYNKAQRPDTVPVQRELLQFVQKMRMRLDLSPGFFRPVPCRTSAAYQCPDIKCQNHGLAPPDRLPHSRTPVRSVLCRSPRKPRQCLFQLVSFLFFIVHNADSDHRAFLPPRKDLYKYDIPPNAAASTFYERIVQFSQDISGGSCRSCSRRRWDHYLYRLSRSAAAGGIRSLRLRRIHASHHGCNGDLGDGI